MIWLYFAYVLIGLGWGFFCRPAGLFNPWDKLGAYLLLVFFWPLWLMVAAYIMIRNLIRKPPSSGQAEPNE